MLKYKSSLAPLTRAPPSIPAWGFPKKKKTIKKGNNQHKLYTTPNHLC